jgi:hypothetical protein
MENSEINPKHDQYQSDLSSAILKTFDDKYSQDKARLEEIAIQKQKEQIFKLEKELKIDIENLSDIIQKIFDKVRRDYVSTFTTFMDTVRKDLKLKLEQMEKIEEEKRKINDIRLIKCERDYFRQESIRMNNLCKNLKTKIDDMTLRMKILSDEVNNVTIKWKDSEIANKQLVLELEKNIENHKELENEMIQMKDLLQKENFENNNNEKSFLNSTREDDDYSKEKLIYMVEKLRADLKKEKIKNSKTLGELNKILLEKNKLENIFIDCVEETRKNIFNRRLKDNLIYNNKKKVLDSYKNININSKYDSFLPSDKKAILENFVFNDEVSNIIRETIFNKPKKDKEISDMNKKMMDKINLGDKGNNINVVDHTKSSFYKTGRMTMTHFNKKFGTSSPLSFPMHVVK